MPGDLLGFPPDERFPPDDPREEIYLEDLCFDAQQAAEKAIKAVLIYLDVRFPYVHDLAQLLTLIEQEGEGIPESIKRAAGLSNYVVETRYPGLAEPVTWEEYEEAVAIADVSEAALSIGPKV